MKGPGAQAHCRAAALPWLSPMATSNQLPYVCSWSGGKDSCLALHRAMVEHGPATALLNMLSEDGEHSRSHGLTRAILQAQADAIGVPILFGSATWEDYETAFVDLLRSSASRGAKACAFGDINLDAHREWEERVCASAGLRALLPIWEEDHGALVREFLDAGFRAIIVTLDTERVPEDCLGRELDAALLAEFADQDIDVCGEAGEFHTLVIDGPIFRAPVTIGQGKHIRMGKYAVLDLG